MSSLSSLPSLFRRLTSWFVVEGLSPSAGNLRHRLLAALVLVVTAPWMCLGPSLALETAILLPAGSASAVSADLLPDKTPERVEEGSRSSDVDETFREGHVGCEIDPPFLFVPFAADGVSYLLLLETSGSLWGQPLHPQNWVEVYAEESDPDQVEESVATGHLDEELPLPDAEVGMDPPEENGEGWVPADAPEGGEDPEIPDDILRERPRNPTMVEQEVGQCAVAGEVSDATTLEPIAGAIVSVVGTGREDETDAQGRFEIGGLPSGDYSIEVLKLGYSMGETTASPRPGSPAEVRLALRVKPTGADEGEFLLAEEVIVGEYNESNQADFDLGIELGANIGSGLDKSEFTRSGISDAAGAVSKIAGANIVGGRYAVVRGLGDRYSNTTVNGALISSADPSRKSVQLDLFPSDLLESINIFKTFTPNYPGEFAGGLVAINTLSFPEEAFAEFEMETGFNENLDADTFYTVPGRDLGLLGKPNDGLGPLVGDLASGGLSEGWDGRRPPNLNNPTQAAAAEEGIRAWNSLHLSGGMRPAARDPELGRGFSASFGNTHKFDNGLEVGFVGSGVWGAGDQIRQGVEVGRVFNGGADGMVGTADDRLERTQIEDRYTAFAGYGLLGSIGVRAGDRHQISYTYFQNHRGEDQVQRGRDLLDERSTTGTYLPASQNPFGAGAYTYQAFDTITPLQRTLTLNQVVGGHEFGDEDNPIEFDWVFSRSEAIEDRANTRTLFYSQLDFADPRIVTEQGDVYDPSLGTVFTAADVYDLSPPENESFRESLKTVEEAGNERVDLVFPVWDRNENDWFKLSTGLNHFDRDREVRGRFFINRVGNGLNGNLLDRDGGQYGVDYLNNYDSLYEPDGTPKFDGWSGNPNRSDKLILLEQSTSGRTVRNVDASTDLAAGYLMGDLSLAGWSIVGGVRYEEEERTYDVLAGLNPSFAVTPGPVSESSAYWLPGIVIGREFGRDQQFDVTLGWSKTVARPTFYEFAPVITEDQASGDEVQGNPDLTDTRISNYDLRVGWRPTNDTSVAVSLFHKSMTDPIAQAYELGRKTWVNGEEGTLQGVEFEVSHRFLEDWSISSNFTYIDSSLVYLQRRGVMFDEISTTFEGQPNHIFNMNLGWDDADSGWSANLIYNFTGSYLTGVPLSDVDPAIRRESFDLLDLVVQKRFDLWDGVGIVKLKCGNLLDSVDKQVFDGTDLVYESYSPGRNFSLSFKFEY
ncbi:outer membrane beta-barrel protein [Haloferula rosea]|uniref:Outer membrane beta-barrel protein n=1 Tax=Haloferula rosea TaxID=490093 RepID=A0A934RH07_9BACT|nr:outer membrane beta-barrel protein [Haloferula rosea]MBK1828180.1 outer membrane beta-barrel protein [Haloferula rosea]